MFFLVLPNAYRTINLFFENTSIQNKTEQTNASAATKTGNTYHIILDAHQSDAFKYLINNKLIDKIDDFTFYENFHTQFGITYVSIPDILSGHAYKPNTSFIRWRENYMSDGLLKILFDNNIGISYYSTLYQRPTFPVLYFTRDGLFKKHASFPFYFDLWFRNLLPNMLIGFLDKYGHEEPVQIDIRSGLYGFSLSKFLGFGVNEGHGHSSLKMFHAMLEQEKKLSKKGRYVFCHLMIPHEPYVFDKNGNNSKPEPKTLDKYLNMSAYSISLLNKLIQTLKSLNRYEDSLIIVQGDHGAYWHKSDFTQNKGAFSSIKLRSLNRNTSTITSQDIEGASSALLLVKLPHEKKTFSISKINVKSIDLMPTILEHFNLDFENIEGIPIQIIDLKANTRVLNFYIDTFINSSALENNYFPDSLVKYTKFPGNDWAKTETIIPLKEEEDSVYKMGNM